MYFPNPAVRGINLLKLHGALDIFTFNNGNDLLKLLPSGNGVSAVTATLRAANEELLYFDSRKPDSRVRTTNEIAYADDSGEMQFLRRSLLAGAHKFDEQHHQVLPKSMMMHFRSYLNFVTNLICIGYSFGDVRVNEVLRRWLTFAANRRLEIVAPELLEIPNFLRHLAPQITLQNMGATDYLDTFAGLERPRKERLEKQVFDHCRKLGQNESRKLLSKFNEVELAKVRSHFIEKVRRLPINKDGQPEIGAIRDAEALGKAWGREIVGTQEEMLERLLTFLKNSKD